MSDVNKAPATPTDDDDRTLVKNLVDSVNGLLEVIKSEREAKNASGNTQTGTAQEGTANDDAGERRPKRKSLFFRD